MVAMAPNLGWRDVPLGPMIEAALQTGGPVIVANDADLGALAELRRGAAVGAHDVLYISGEVGVGGGTPHRRAAADGHDRVRRRGRPHARQPARLAVPLWFRRLLGDRGRGGDAPPTGWRAADGGREAVAPSCADAAAGSPKPRGRLDHVGRWLGIGLASLVNVFDPALIVLGGLFGRILPYVTEPMADELGPAGPVGVEETRCA